MAERPRLKMVDDPLAPARTSPQRESDPKEHDAAEEPPRAGTQRATRVPLQGIFGRVPPEFARRLEGMVFELKAERARVAQQDILAALLWRYVDHTEPASVRAVHELLDEYEAAAEGRWTAGPRANRGRTPDEADAVDGPVPHDATAPS